MELHYSQIKKNIKEKHDNIEEYGEGIYKIIKGMILSGSYREPGWYFVDETWSDFVGPYSTRQLCEEGLTKYAIRLEGGSS